MNLVSSEAEEGEATADRRASPLDCFERFVLRTTSFGGRRQSTLKHPPCLTNDSTSYGLSAEIGIARPNQFDHILADARNKPVVRGAATSLVDQRSAATFLIPRQQSKGLPHTKR